MSGYALIHRSLIGHPAFRNESEAMLFAWLILKAAWRPVRVRYKGHSISLKRGQVAASVRDMADAHDRNKNWISRVLNTMREEDMITTDAGTGVLVITIRNYDQYQAVGADEGTHNGTARGTASGTQEGQRRDTEQRREEGKKEEQSSRTHAREAALPADVRSVMEEAGFVSPPQDLALLKDWYAAGATLEQDIIPAIRRVRPRLDRPPFKLKVFDSAIREKLATDEAEIQRLRGISRRFEHPNEAGFRV